MLSKGQIFFFGCVGWAWGWGLVKETSSIKSKKARILKLNNQSNMDFKLFVYKEESN